MFVSVLKYMFAMAVSMSCSKILSELLDKAIGEAKSWWTAEFRSNEKQCSALG